MHDDPNPVPTIPIATGPPEPLIKWGWLRGVIYYVVIMVTVAIASVIPALVFNITSTRAYLEALDEPFMILVHGITLAVCLLVTWVFRRFLDRRSMVSLGFGFGREYRRDFFYGSLWGIGLVAFVFGTLLVSGYVRVVATAFPIGSMAVLFGVMALAAFQEELIVRGYILNNFMKSMNPFLALLFSSVLFSISHASNPNIDLVALANIIIAGLVLGIYYIHRQNLWFPFGLHLTWNFFQGTVFGSPVSGIDMPGVMTIEISGEPLISGGYFGFEASLVTTVVIAAATVVLHLVYQKKRGQGKFPVTSV